MNFCKDCSYHLVSPLVGTHLGRCSKNINPDNKGDLLVVGNIRDAYWFSSNARKFIYGNKDDCPDFKHKPIKLSLFTRFKNWIFS